MQVQEFPMTCEITHNGHDNVNVHIAEDVGKDDHASRTGPRAEHP